MSGGGERRTWNSSFLCQHFFEILSLKRSLTKNGMKGGTGRERQDVSGEGEKV